MEELPKNILSILRGDEQLLWWGRPVFKSFILHLGSMWGFFFAGSLLIAGIMAASSILPPMPIGMLYGFSAVLTIQATIGLLMFIGPIIRNVIAYNNTFYLITNRRILIQTGAIGIDTRIIEFDKIQEIYVTMDFIDKIFGTGSIKISTAAGWPEHAYMPTLTALRNPHKVHNILQSAMEERNH